MKELFKDFVGITIVCAIILCFYYFNIKLKNMTAQPNPENQPVVATTWGWQEITSMPVPIVTTNKNDHLLLSQIKFMVNGWRIYTALIDGKVCLDGWKIGDKILVAEVPGMIGNIPDSTFIVIGYRPQEQNK